MYVIGLTGNIATGKSTVAAMLQQLGAFVINADKVTHEVMCAGTKVHRRVVERFGTHVLNPRGEIDRAGLGRIVFASPEALRDLERIIHPAVLEEILARLTSCEADVAVIEAIKLLEASLDKRCDSVWVVVSPRKEQLERLRRTRQLTTEQADLRVDAQSPPENKIAHADCVIDNSGELQGTWDQILEAWNAIPGLSKAPLDELYAGP